MISNKYLKEQMIEAFRLANEVFFELRKRRLRYGDPDHAISMIAREIFRIKVRGE